MIILPTLPLQITDKYDISRNTFIRKDKGEVAEEREVEIGDIKQDDFFPQVKLTQWGETNFSVRLKHTEKNAKIETDGDKVKWKGRKVEAHFYEVEKTDDLPKAFELEVLLLEKPKTNKVEFTTQTKGLKFYYQPELTQKEKDDGAFRPENVVGSYAVYHESKQGDYSKMGKKNYRAGKAFHIYRPKIIDSAGKEVWGELNITDNLLTVEIPQEFLDNAVYPVRHAAGLTFGYTTAGTAASVAIAGSSYNRSTTVGFGTTLSQDGTLDKITMRLKANSVENVDISAIIYREDSAGANSHDKVVGIERASLSVTTDIDGAWYDFIASDETLVADNYILAGLGNGEDITTNYKSIAIKADSGGDRYYTELTDDAGSYATRKAEDPWTEVDAANSWIPSIYCTYTAGGGSDLKSINGVALADIKSINGIAIANIKSINGITK